MAICDICGTDMTTAEGCVPHLVVYGDGTKLPAVIFKIGDGYLPDDHCLFCNAKDGHYHHLGCSAEQCPHCHGQLISCSCGIAGVEVVANGAVADIPTPNEPPHANRITSPAKARLYAQAEETERTYRREAEAILFDLRYADPGLNDAAGYDLLMSLRKRARALKKS